jgi:hypothetical protein
MASVARAAAAALLGIVLTGCSMASSTAATAPAGVTQQLLIRSLERALAQIDRSKIGAHPVALEVTVQSGNEGFVKDFVTTWLKAHGVHVAGDSPEMKLKMFVAVYGTDHDQTLIGLPAFQAPVVNVPVPELALFKWVRNRGQTELRLWAFDVKSDTIVDAPSPGVGRSKYDDFTVLLFFGFSLSDVNKHGN